MDNQAVTDDQAVTNILALVDSQVAAEGPGCWQLEAGSLSSVLQWGLCKKVCAFAQSHPAKVVGHI